MAHDRINFDPKIMGGKPVIRGTRIPVELILRKLGAGMDTGAIIADHPRLTARTSVPHKPSRLTISPAKNSSIGERPPGVRWLADECVDAGLVADLRKAGRDVVYMAEIDAGADDLAALRRAKEEARLRIPEDKDFGELVFRGRRSTPGLVLVRIDPRARHLKWPRLFAAIARFGQTIVGHYVVIDEVHVRSRPLPQR